MRSSAYCDLPRLPGRPMAIQPRKPVSETGKSAPPSAGAVFRDRYPDHLNVMEETFMPTSKQSPAVQSMRKEQKEQRTRARMSELDTGLEGTFPASDPISATRSAVSVVRVDAEAANSAMRQQAAFGSPLVSKTARTAKADGWSAVREIEDRIRKQPLTAVAVVAALAWVFGATR